MLLSEYLISGVEREAAREAAAAANKAFTGGVVERKTVSAKTHRQDSSFLEAYELSQAREEALKTMLDADDARGRQVKVSIKLECPFI